MMTAQEVDTALLQALVDLALGIPIAYPNEDFTPPTDGSDWIMTTQLPAITEAASLGVGGWDRLLGILQIDFNSKPGTGTATLLGYAQAALDEYVAGKNYTSGSQTVKVLQAYRSQILEIDGWARVAVSVSWQALTVRPAI
jgi:hypothetical protein